MILCWATKLMDSVATNIDARNRHSEIPVIQHTRKCLGFEINLTSTCTVLVLNCTFVCSEPHVSSRGLRHRREFRTLHETSMSFRNILDGSVRRFWSSFYVRQVWPESQKLGHCTTHRLFDHGIALGRKVDRHAIIARSESPFCEQTSRALFGICRLELRGKLFANDS
jgi:hypothetical protein